MNHEKRYVSKIKNDVDERLYELLMLHLRDIDQKINIHGEDNDDTKREFVSILEIAIDDLRKNINNYNKLSHYRYIIMICNTILRFNKDRQDLKDIKKEIIEEFTHSDRDENGFIPLNYQMNEVRITYDVNYLSYLVQKYIDRYDWINAMYCYKAVEMLEPDDPRIDWWKERITRNLKGKDPYMAQHQTPIGKRLALDSNIAISMISDDIGRYRFREKVNYDKTILDSNDLLITPSVRDEVCSHVDFMKVKIAKFCKRNDGFDRDSIISEFQDRYDDIMASYLVDGISGPERKLEVSHRLRKLAQREGLLPEEGDMRLLSEIMAMRENGERVDGILSLDKDLTLFSGDILDEFGIEVYMPL